MTRSEDVEATYFVPSFLMADPMGPFLDQYEEEEGLSPSSSLEGKLPASPPLSFSSGLSSLSPSHSLLSSPPPSPPHTHLSSFPPAKMGSESPSFHWLEDHGPLADHEGAVDYNDDVSIEMEWMLDSVSLNDLYTFVGSCSPEDLVAPLNPDVDLESLDATVPPLHDSLELPAIPSLPEELSLSEEATAEKVPEVVVKSEPSSPPLGDAPPSPPTLEVGREEDVADVEMESRAAVSQAGGEDPRSYRSNPEVSLKASPPTSDCESDSGFESFAGSPPRALSPPSTPSSAGSSRTKPYSKQEPGSSPSTKASRVKSVSGAPKVVEKKLKKMEQNKTAATRYRQKKRVEQELLNVEREELEKKNLELTEKAESISREIQYLKDLMEEVRKHHRGKTTTAAAAVA